MARRKFFAILALAATLHVVGIARTTLPAQDGLKFIRIARQFTHRPWVDVVRGADQHPLYPALIALAEPAVAPWRGHGPDTWRIAAQGVSALASLALLFPLFGLTRALFDERIALLATLIFVLLPFPAEIGRDTLSDSVALLGFLLALRLGEIALRSRGWMAPVGCGLLAGVGYLARPEVLVAPAAVLIAAALRRRSPACALPRLVPRFTALGIAFLAIVGVYALVKGEVSEKLALRRGAEIGSRHVALRQGGQWLPPGLDDPRWDFSPKEESGDPPRARGPLILARLAQQWAEGLGWIGAFLAIWGLVRDRHIRRLIGRTDDDGPGSGRRLIAVYLLLFSAVLIRHGWKMGYLSGRHVLTLVVVSIPWVAAGLFICFQRLTHRCDWSESRVRPLRLAALGLLIALGASFALIPSHASRWGHWAAGQWLKSNARPSDAVLDTRGWAAFVSGQPSYDYWHVRQAFTDSHLAYIVVGTDELEARTRRAATLKAVLAYTAAPVAAFPERKAGQGVGVRIYRYQRPVSWEGLRP